MPKYSMRWCYNCISCCHVIFVQVVFGQWINTLNTWGLELQKFSSNLKCEVTNQSINKNWKNCYSSRWVPAFFGFFKHQRNNNNSCQNPKKENQFSICKIALTGWSLHRKHKLYAPLEKSPSKDLLSWKDGPS